MLMQQGRERGGVCGLASLELLIFPLKEDPSPSTQLQQGRRPPIRKCMVGLALMPRSVTFELIGFWSGDRDLDAEQLSLWRRKKYHPGTLGPHLLLSSSDIEVSNLCMCSKPLLIFPN